MIQHGLDITIRPTEEDYALKLKDYIRTVHEIHRISAIFAESYNYSPTVVNKWLNHILVDPTYDNNEYALCSYLERESIQQTQKAKRKHDELFTLKLNYKKDNDSITGIVRKHTD